MLVTCKFSGKIFSEHIGGIKHDLPIIPRLSKLDDL